MERRRFAPITWSPHTHVAISLRWQTFPIYIQRALRHYIAVFENYLGVEIWYRGFAILFRVDWVALGAIFAINSSSHSAIIRRKCCWKPGWDSNQTTTAGLSGGGPSHRQSPTGIMAPDQWSCLMECASCSCASLFSPNDGHFMEQPRVS